MGRRSKYSTEVRERAMGRVMARATGHPALESIIAGRYTPVAVISG